MWGDCSDHSLMIKNRGSVFSLHTTPCCACVCCFFFFMLRLVCDLLYGASRRGRSHLAENKRRKKRSFGGHVVSTHFTDTACTKHAKALLNSLHSWEGFTAVLQLLRGPCSSPYKRALNGLFESTHKSIELAINQPWHMALCKVRRVRKIYSMSICL